MGNKQEIERVWRILKTKGKEIGFFVNHKSAIYKQGFEEGCSADVERKKEGLMILRAPVGSEK